MDHSPFDTIESAEEFMQLLHAEIQKAHREMESLLTGGGSASSRHVEALRLVLHKLSQLREHSEASQRILRDLRALRNLLLR